MALGFLMLLQLLMALVLGASGCSSALLRDVPTSAKDTNDTNTNADATASSNRLSTSTLLLAIIAPCVALVAFLLVYCLYRSKRLIGVTSGDTHASSSGLLDEDGDLHKPGRRRLGFPFWSNRTAEPASNAAIHAASMRISSSSSSLSPVSSTWQQSSWCVQQADSKSTTDTNEIKSRETRGASYASLQSPAHSFMSALRVTSEIGDDDLRITTNLTDETNADGQSRVVLNSDWSSGVASSGGDMTGPADIHAASRLAAKRRLRYALERVVNRSHTYQDSPVTLSINRNRYVVTGAPVEETSLALLVRCVDSRRSPLVLKFFVHHDEPLARNEWNALRRVYQYQHQRQTALNGDVLPIKDDPVWPIVPELVDAQLHHSLSDPGSPSMRALSCSVLALRPGTSTTFLHIARNHVDTGRRESVLAQLERVVQALRALHSSGIVHCGLSMTSLTVFQGDKLRFWGLEHAMRRDERVVPSLTPSVTGFGVDTVVMDPPASEFVAPELAKMYISEQEKRANRSSRRLDGSSSYGTNIWGRSSSRSRHLNRVSGMEPVMATSALDVWSLGVLILKMYCDEKQLDELRAWQLHHHENVFEDNEEDDADVNGVLQRLADPHAFRGFARSLEFYVEHDDVRDLARRCLSMDPTRRPTLEDVMAHPCWQRFRPSEVSAQGSYIPPIPEPIDKRESVTVFRRTVVPSLQRIIVEERDSQFTDSCGPNDSIAAIPHASEDDDEMVEAIESSQTPLPPSLWLLLPPVGSPALECVDVWAAYLEHLQSECRGNRRSSSSSSSSTFSDDDRDGSPTNELLFPLLPMCEHCGTAGCCNARPEGMDGSILVPESLLALVVPVVQESLLFLRARAVIAGSKDEAAANGLTSMSWISLLALYEAMERLAIVSASLTTAPMLAPLERLLASREPAQARQVLDELKCLVFSAEKREFVRGLLDVLAVTDASALALSLSLSGHREDDEESAEQPEEVVDSRHKQNKAERRRQQLVACRTNDASAHMTATRWLCATHREDEAEAA